MNLKLFDFAEVFREVQENSSETSRASALTVSRYKIKELEMCIKSNLKVVTVLLLFTLLYLLFICCEEEKSENSNITLKQAEQIIFIELLDSNDSGKVVYELPYIMNIGDTVKTKGGDSTYVAKDDCWFFFIDDQPGYRWVHPCRYSFVSCDDGEYIVIDERNEPENIDSLIIVNF
jgi:hypothetical protein